MRRSPRAISTLPFIAFIALIALACGKSAGSPEDEVPLPDRGEADATSDAAVEPDTSTTEAGVDTGTDADAGASLRVFAISGTTSGRMGGVVGADKICATYAAKGNLPGKFVAWLSTKDGINAADRVTSAGPWRLVSGELVVDTKIALIGGSLKHAIDHDEKGAAVAVAKVWTGSGPTGQYLTNDCDAWTTGNNGRVGKSDETSAGWTTFDVDDCDALRRLYCFQVQ